MIYYIAVELANTASRKSTGTARPAGSQVVSVA